MELYRKVRLACRDGMSERAAARHFGVSRQSVRKMLQFSVPPGPPNGRCAAMGRHRHVETRSNLNESACGLITDMRKHILQEAVPMQFFTIYP